MGAKTARWIFYLGTLISAALFIGLTVDTHRQIRTLTHADQLSEQVVAGKRVWQKYNCNDCHTILGFGGYYAPEKWLYVVDLLTLRPAPTRGRAPDLAEAP